jgi:hypothetical protein
MSGRPDLLWARVRLAAIIVLTACLAASAQPPGASAPTPVSFKKSMEYSLAEERTRIREIAEPVLARFRKMRAADQEGSIINQTISVQGAEVAYQNAKLTREVAEIAVKEYEEGIYVQDRLTAQGEMLLAESDHKRSTDKIEMTRELLGRVKKAASGSVFDIMSVAQMEGNVYEALLSKVKTELALDQAKTKLKLLEEYEKPKRLKELRSEVEKARSDELNREMTLEVEKSKLARMKKPAEAARLPAKYQHILSLLADAVRLDGQVRGKLAKLGPKDDDPHAGPRKDLEELARSLDARVSEAGQLFEDLKFAELASEINFAATRPAAATGSLTPRIGNSFSEKFRNISPEDREKLRNATDEERIKILKKAGFTDDELKQMQEMRERMLRSR